MKNPVILFFFLFFNLYYPISPYLCMGIDVIFIVLYGNFASIKSYSSYIFLSLLLLFLALISLGFSSEPEMQVLFKYLRSFIATVVLIIIASGIKASPNLFSSVISFVLLLHVITIVAQLLFPPLGWIMAPFFNFDRDIDLVQNMQLRKMGLSGGFDSAAMLVISNILFFYNKFYYKGNLFFFFLSVFAMTMSLFVSRTGLLLAAGCMLYFAFISLRGNRTVKFAGIMMFLGFFFAVAFLILPILVATNGLLFDVNMDSEVDVSFLTQDYSTANGSVGHLVGDHLYAVEKLNLLQFLFGAGNSSDSDIGYVQALYQTGLLGVIFVVLLHFNMFRDIRRFKSKDKTLLILKSFCLTYIIVLFLLNYKILLLYSRGFYDFLLICYVYINNYNSNSRKFITTVYEEKSI